MPSNMNDIINERLSGRRIDLMGGDDTLIWNRDYGPGTVSGGSTNERYDSNPYTPGNPGGDTIRISGSEGAFIRFDTTENGIVRIGTTVLRFDGFERVYGSAGDDVVRAGNAKINAPHDGTPAHGISIFTGAGNDNIVASAFDDVIDGGSGNDKIWAGNGNDFIHSSTGNDTISGGLGDENIRWGVGNTQEHNPGNDVINGGEGNDLINVWVTNRPGWSGPVEGGTVKINFISEAGAFNGVATVPTNDARTEISTLRFSNFEQGWTHEGRDVIDGSKARVMGDQGFHWNGRWGDDRLIGSKGDDTLEGGEGRDTITGGKGDDLMSANGDFYRWDAPADGDVDTFIFNLGDGNDTILGFNPDQDVLMVGNRTYETSETDRGTLLEFANGDSIFLSNVFDF